MAGPLRHLGELARAQVGKRATARADGEALPDPAALERFVRAPGKAVGVPVGHTHFDHAVDAPELARQLDCKAYGSASLVNLMALHGMPERAVEVEPYSVYELGPFEVSFTPSAHSKLLLGLAVPYDGELTCEHLDSLSPAAYRCAGVAGRSFTERYWRRILPLLEPRVVVPTHYDNFFRPLGQDLEFVTAADLARLPEEIGAVSGEIELAALPRADLG